MHLARCRVSLVPCAPVWRSVILDLTVTVTLTNDAAVPDQQGGDTDKFETGGASHHGLWSPEPAP